MSAKDVEITSSCSSEGTSQSKDDKPENMEKVNVDSLEKSENEELQCSTTNNSKTTENILDTSVLCINQNNENLIEQPSSELPIEIKETSPIDALEDESNSDAQEDEIKLTWDDDEYPVELGGKAIHITKELCGDIGEAINKDESDDLSGVDNLKNNKKFIKQAEQLSRECSSTTSQRKSFVDNPALEKKDHGINKPDVMLDIPGMLPGMQEELESMNVEMFSDSERASDPEDVDKGLSESGFEVKAEIPDIFSSFDESELNSKLEMSSDNDDDSSENTCNDDETKLVEAVENEMKLISDTVSSIKETKPMALPEMAIEPPVDKLNLISAINNEVKSLADTLSNMDQDDPIDSVPIAVSKPASIITEEINITEPQATPCEQREKDMNLKVSTLISSIEEEMQLLDSNDEMEISEVTLDIKTIKKPNNKNNERDLISSDSPKIEVKETSTTVIADQNIAEDVSCTPQEEAKDKELDESKLIQIEQDELALAVKAIEQSNNHIVESAPAVTLVNVNTADELSEISVIDEDDQPSISLVFDDDDESIEVLQQSLGPVSAVIDESEVSVIQDSEDEEPVILIPDADDLSTDNIAQDPTMIMKIQDINEEQEVNVQRNVISTNCNEPEKPSVTNLIQQVDKPGQLLALKETFTESEPKTAESVCVEVGITTTAENDNKKEDIVLSPSTTINENNSKTQTLMDNNNIPEVNNTVSDNIASIEEKKLISDENKIKSLDNVNMELSQTSQGVVKDINEVTSTTSDKISLIPEQEKATSCDTENRKLSVLSEQDAESIEPQPSTSTVDLDLNKDSSNDVPDSDTLGLLAESTRVMGDDDDQDDDEDDDEEFYHDDDSTMAESTNSEESSNALIVQVDVHHGHCSQLSESIATTNNVCVSENQATSDLTSIDRDFPKTAEERMKENSDLKKKEHPGENNRKHIKSGAERVRECKVRKKAKSQSAESSPKPEEKDKSPSKILGLSVSSQQTVWNFVDLEESSEDEIQTVQKPAEVEAPTKVEEQPELEQTETVKQLEKETQPQPSEATCTPVVKTTAEVDVEINVEVLDEELQQVDDTAEADLATTKKIEREEEATAACQKQQQHVGGLEVFNLDSDDEDTAAPVEPAEDAPNQPEPDLEPEPELEADLSKRDLKCVNSSCQYAPGVQWHAADAATITYYDADKRRRWFVCDDCWQPVQARNEELMEGIRNCTPLLELNMATFSLDLVEISDSDSEGEPEPDDLDKEKIGDVAAKFLEENLADMINKTWVKYQMDSRLADTESVLQMELRRLETESKEIHTFLDECQATTDRIRNELYASFPQDIRQMPPLTVFDTPDQQYCFIQTAVPVKEDSPTPVPTRMSKRRLEAAASAAGSENPPKRPAIPLGYTPLGSPDQPLENKAGKSAEAGERIDDDNVEVSVVNIISSEAAPPGLPPTGELVKPPLRVGMMVYAMRNSFGSWVKGKILEIMPKGTQSLTFTTCKVKFENKVTKTPMKTILARCMAYSEPANVRLTIGTRVIANFKDMKDNKDLPQADLKRESFFSGIVAEVPNPVNKYRYLIFFDDGYAQYASHADTRLVCECASLVWEEVHPFSREFVREYLLAYPERPMVRLHPSQSLKTEWNGKWWPSRVVAVDASLAQVQFTANNRYEWIYRGSTRLAPLYLELQAAERHRARPMPRAQAHGRANMPVVEYTRYDEANKTFEAEKTQQQRQEAEAIRQRAVAKKSTGGVASQSAPPARPPPTHNLDNVTSRVVYYTPKSAVKPHKMVPHTCGPKCRRTDVLALKELRTYNPLAKPLLSGWERQTVRYKGQKAVMYRAPCGRRVRCARELHRYLRATRSDLPVDLFDFSPATHCLAEFVLNKCLIMKKDLSQGKENVPVPCVNYYDESLPEFCLYNTERTPTAGVPLNLDPDFLCGCDCDDDCEDKSKCACWKLTLEGARTIGLEGDNVGYVYKRLPEPLPSGIYECNSRCKCKHTCLNRVAQHPLQLKLQIFKTLNRGWGIRALNDVPKGAFLCVYAGNLLTDATANLDGLNEGDEYLAELDYIEVVEQMKEGYEEDIPKDLKKMSLDEKDKDDEDSEQEESSEEESQVTSKTELEDDDFQPAPHVGLRLTQFSKRLRQRNRNKEESAADDKKDVEKEKEKEKEKDKEKEKEEDKEKEKEEPKKEGERGSNDEDCITISDDDEVREPSSFAAAAGMGANAFVSKYRSVRGLFGEDESCYIMDAKVQGNIGRYLNHSCSPNVFVQNVFVDTHDPRFPWVAFFALSHVRAGTELTWNYNYDVGSVPGKALYCYCGAANCRGRLL